MATQEELQKELERLQEEFEELSTQTKESEARLEKTLEEKESKLRESLQKLQTSKDHLESLTQKFHQNESEKLRLSSELSQITQKIQKFEEEKQELEALNDQWEKSAKFLEYSKQTLEEKLYQAEENAILYKEELEDLEQKRLEKEQKLREEYQELKQELVMIKITTTKDPSPKVRCPTPTLRHTFENVISIPVSSQRPSSRPSSRPCSRRGSIDETQAKQNVRVLVLFRPPGPNECWDPQVLSLEGKSVTVKEKGKDSKSFEFEKVFRPGFSQSEVFAEVKEAVDKLVDAGSACVMAYGQTGSGKTYTMNSVISLALLHLAEVIGEEYSVSLQCIEVYNEQLKNLLNDEPLSKNWKDVIAKAEVRLKSDWKSTAWDLVQTAISRRITKYTESNERSSRSHAIITLNVLGPLGTGKVQFVDLAGSERIGKSQVVGDTLKEAVLINKSLSALQDVVTALENRQKHIPYRNSMLTQILQPTLGGSDSLVTMIMNCNPALDSLSETLNTLALASRVKAVDLGFFIRKNLVNKEVERTLSLLEKERSEKNSLLRMLDKLQRDLENFRTSLKDKDCKIASLAARVRGKEDIRKSIDGRKKTLDAVDRVVSLSPNALHSPLSPVGSSRIPSLVSLKFRKRDNK